MKSTRTITNRTADQGIARASNRKVSPIERLSATIEKEYNTFVARKDHRSGQRWKAASRDYHYLTGAKHRLSAPIEVK